MKKLITLFLIFIGGITSVLGQPYMVTDTIPYQFVDISSTGTLLGSGDDVGFTVTLGAPFEFYGMTYNQLEIASNGFLSTSSGSGGDLSNDCPLPASPSTGSGGRIYVLHDDLDLDAAFGGEMYYQYFAVSPRPHYSGVSMGASVFQWENAEHFNANGSNQWDMQVFLYDNGDIVMQIGTGNNEQGSSSTTGIMNPAANQAAQYACNTTNSIPDNSAIMFYLPPPVLYDAALIDYYQEYTKIPLSQVPTTIEATAENNGIDPLTGVVISINVFDQTANLVATYSSSPINLAPGATTTFSVPGGLNPNVPGVYNIEYSVTSNEVDQFLANNDLTQVVEFTDGLYARDNGDLQLGIGIGVGTAGSLGNQFEIINTAAIIKAEAVFGDPIFSPPAGTEYEMAIWNMSGGFPDTIIATVTGVIAPGGIQTQTLEFDQPVILQPGEYVLTVEEPASVNITLGFADSIITESKHWVRFATNPFGNADGWSNLAPFGGIFNQVPMVRAILNSGCFLAIAGADTTICEGESVMLGGNPSADLGTPPYAYQWLPTSGLSNFQDPNPVATPSTTTTYTLNVTDSTGCVVSDEVTITVNPLPAADISGLAAQYCSGDAQDTLIVSPAGGTMSGPGATIINNSYNASYTGPPVSIPDAIQVNGNANLTPSGIPGTSVGSDILLTQVCFEITHTWIGDVVVELVSPNGTVVPLMDRPGFPALFFGCSGDNIDACVIPGTGNPMENECNNNPAISGTYTAHTGFDLASLNDGSNPNGTWTLRARDFVGGDAGTIDNFTLTFTQSFAIFDPATAGPGTHHISYCVTSADGCVGCDVDTVIVNPAPDASLTIPPGNICAQQTPFNIIPGYPGGIFSGNGIVDPNTGLFDPSMVGPGSTTVYYEVTDTNGCFGMDSLLIVIEDVPVTDAGSDQTICAGSSVILGGTPTGTAQPGNFIVQYEWMPATGLNSNTDPNPVASPAVTTTYVVGVTNNLGCVGYDTVTVFVSPQTTVDAGADQTICQGSTVTIGGFPTASGGTPPYTYNWNPSTGLTSATAPNPNASPMGTTTYTVMVTDANGCTGTDAVTIFVNPAPVADAGADQNVCSNAPVVLGGSPAATGGTPGYTYNWAPATGLSATNVANPLASGLTTTTTYTLTVTDASGCTDSDEITIVITPGPTADAGADQNLCVGGSATIGGFPTATGGTPGYTYIWSPNVGLNSNNIANPIATPSSTTSYTVTVTDANGCTSTDEVLVTINASPNAEAGPDKNACLGDPVVIGGNPTATGGSAPYSYNWMPAAGLNNSAASNPLATPTVATTYTVVVTDDNGCTASDVVTVNVNPSPTANAGPDVDVCFGESVQIGGNPAGSGGTGALIYSWAPTNGLNNPNTANPIAMPGITRTYVLTVSDGSGCSDTDTVTVTVNPLPQLTISGLDSSYCIDDPVVGLTGTPSGGTFAGAGIQGSTFTPVTAGAGWHIISYTYTDANGCENVVKAQVRVYEGPFLDAGPDQTIKLGGSTVIDVTGPAVGTYIWTPSDGLNNDMVEDPVASPTATTTYTVTVTGQFGCDASDEVTIFVDEAISINPPNTFTPNADGTNDTWIIPALDFFPNNRVEIYNRWGQQVFEQDNYGQSNAWSGDDLPEGTYFYVITISGNPSQEGRVHKGTITIIR